MKPKLVVALGATAAFALMGRTLILARERGRLRAGQTARRTCDIRLQFCEYPTRLRGARLFPASPAICARRCGSPYRGLAEQWCCIILFIVGSRDVSATAKTVIGKCTKCHARLF